MLSDKSFLTELGRNVRAERKKSGYSQEDLAEKSGLYRTYIGVVERGERNITLSKCSEIAQALNVALSDLIRQAEESSLRKCDAL
jgi:transcriptional regulator with XRE-family HTH domain